MGLADKVIDHQLHLLSDGVRVEVHEGLEQVVRFFLVVAWVALDLLDEPPVDFVSGVALQHIEDEPFLDCLAHAVEMERRERPARPLAPEQLKRLGFWSCGEGEGRYVGEVLTLLQLRQHRIVELLLGGHVAGFLRFGFFERPYGEHGLEALRALSRLGRVRLVNDESEPPSGKLTDLPGDERELLKRGYDYGLATFQSILQLPGGLVDVLHDSQRLLELPPRQPAAGGRARAGR